jgi:predicted alpha/beta-fold hydrolase
MSGVIGATHFFISASQEAIGQIWCLDGVPPNMWILVTCNLTTVQTNPVENSELGIQATINILSYLDGDNVTHDVMSPEVHAQGIKQFNVQLNAYNCSAQGTIMVFFGIEGTPPGITPGPLLDC